MCQQRGIHLFVHLLLRTGSVASVWRCLIKVAENGRGGGGRQKRAVLVITFCSRLHITNPVLLIHFTLPVFEKLCEYAEQPHDIIPVSGIAR